MTCDLASLWLQKEDSNAHPGVGWGANEGQCRYRGEHPVASDEQRERRLEVVKHVYGISPQAERSSELEDVVHCESWELDQLAAQRRG